jgi:CSLREA domain-containing protein
MAVAAVACLACGSLQAATITVNSLADTAADDGDCTLREAVTAANADAASGLEAGECVAGSGSDDIGFSIAGTIQPESALPTITTVIHIDGYTAPGASKNTQPLAQGTNAVLVIEIDGVNAGNVAGLRLVGNGASGSVIEGLVINNSGNTMCCAQIGIYLANVSPAATTILRGNFIGTDTTGTLRRPKGSRSIYLDPASNVVIGSDVGGAVDPAAVNLISGTNAAGVQSAGGTNLRIRGNLIGTNAAGTAALTNSGGGVFIDGTTSSWVADNVISGNSGGISLRGTSSDIRIERNLVGRNAAGTAALPNTSVGIRISENPNTTISTIFDVDVVDNVVAHNSCGADCAGILIGENNSVNIVQGIRLSGNRVFANAGLEIDLGLTNATDNGLLYGVTANDPDDADVGANTLQNFPVVTSALGNGADVLIDFTLDSEAGKTFVLEFFHTGTCDDSGHGGAETFLGKEEVNTDGSGDAAEQVVLPLAAESGYITATATEVDNGTSEFSACMAVSAGTIFEDGFEDLAP